MYPSHQSIISPLFSATMRSGSKLLTRKASSSLIMDTDHLFTALSRASVEGDRRTLGNVVDVDCSNWVVCDVCGFYKKRTVLKLNGHIIGKTNGPNNMAWVIYNSGLHPRSPCSDSLENKCGAPLHLPPPMITEETMALLNKETN